MQIIPGGKPKDCSAMNNSNTQTSVQAAKAMYESYRARMLEKKHRGEHFLYIVMERGKPNRTECLYCLNPKNERCVG